MSCILVVEDDAAILRGLADNLKFESYEVLTAEDGETGYRLIREKNPDLIILDVMLPKLDGHRICHRVRAEGVTTPILMLTAQSQEADRVLGLDLGANDYVTKPFSVRELLARVRAALRQRQEWMAERRHLDQQIGTAAEVQQRLFPQFRPAVAGLDYVGFCQPAWTISGDYYDFLDLGPGRLGLLVADVVGKGMAAALLTASLHACVRTHAPLLGDRCGDVVARVNALLYEATDASKFATLFYAVYVDETRQLTYLNAGHEPPLLVDAARTGARDLSFGTPPVGVFPAIPAGEQTVELAPGEWLLIFSDGLTEALDEHEEQFGRERVVQVVLKNPRRSASEMRNAILAEVRSHSSGRPLADDLTLVVAHVV